MSFIIRDATYGDVPHLLDLHNWSIKNLDGIWIEETENLSEREKWFLDRRAEGFPVLVVENDNGKLVGYGSYGTFRGRDGYDLTVEHSIYLYPEAQGHGLGKALLKKLIDLAAARDKHIMVAVIDDENKLSIELHKKLGFIELGTIPEAGKKRGRWRNQVTLYLKLDDRPTPS